MKICLLIVSISLIGCVTNRVQGFQITDVEVVGADYQDERAKQLCSHFNLTTEQARTYFSTAKHIDENKAHHEYDYYSCWASGYLTHEKEQCQWQIDIGGLGNIYCKDQTYSLFCS